MPRTRRAIPAHNLKTTRSGEVKRRNLFWRWRRLFFLAALMAVVAVTGAGYVLSQVELPVDPPPEAQTTFICTAEVVYPTPCNEDNAAAVLHGEEDRVNVELEQVPDVLIDAVVSAEDRDFFEHGGVDPWGIARAAYTDIRGNSASRQGGSTITQQYIKNVYLTDEATLTRKIREAVMAVKLEQEISKEQILENYLNTIYFGRGAYGAQAASQAYFDKDVGELDLPQAALLAGLIRAPHRAEPYEKPEEARRRRRTVLDAMLQEGYITKEERDTADEAGFTILDGGVYPWEPKNSVAVAPAVSLVQGDYFIDYVRSILAERYGNDAVFGGGLRVYTTLDRDMQNHAIQAVIETLDQPEDPDAALVAIDDQGMVRAMVGGRDWANEKVNLAVGSSSGGGGRQPGSTFKAFAVAEAVREGYSVESVVAAPSTQVFPNANDGADWTVRGGCCGGYTSLVEATARSANTTFAELMLRLGPQNVIDMANDLGVTAQLDPYPSAVLGGEEVSVLDMAGAYSTFANEGVQIDPRVIVRVERADGTLLEEFPAERTQVLSADQASQVTHALQQVIDHGTGEEADPGFPVAGKTGTTQNNADAWFAGYTPSLTAAVWMGYHEGSIPMTEVHGEIVAGGNFPSRIWRNFMTRAHADVAVPEEFPEPVGLDEGQRLYPEIEDRYTGPPSGGSGGTGNGGTGNGGTTPGGTDGPTATTAPQATTSTPDTSAPTTAPPATQPPATAPPATEAPAAGDARRPDD